MRAHSFLTSLDCQNRASDCRRLVRESSSLNLALRISHLADMWEAVAIEIELYSPSIPALPSLSPGQ
jgi:hypothetical protein